MSTKTRTKTTHITKLIVAKPVKVNLMGKIVTYRPGRVLATVRHPKFFYSIWPHKIVLGHGLVEVIDTEFLKVSWLIEKATTTTTTTCVDKS